MHVGKMKFEWEKVLLQNYQLQGNIRTESPLSNGKIKGQNTASEWKTTVITDLQNGYHNQSKTKVLNPN